MPTVKHKNIIFFPKEFKTNKEVRNDNVVSMEEFKRGKERKIKEKEKNIKNLFKEEFTLEEIKLQIGQIMQEFHNVSNILDKNGKDLLIEKLATSLKKIKVAIDFCENKKELEEEFKKLNEKKENIEGLIEKVVNNKSIRAIN
jgi:hypothetical protein